MPYICTLARNLLHVLSAKRQDGHKFSKSLATTLQVFIKLITDLFHEYIQAYVLENIKLCKKEPNAINIM